MDYITRERYLYTKMIPYATEIGGRLQGYNVNIREAKIVGLVAGQHNEHDGLFTRNMQVGQVKGLLHTSMFWAGSQPHTGAGLPPLQAHFIDIPPSGILFSPLSG